MAPADARVRPRLTDRNTGPHVFPILGMGLLERGICISYTLAGHNFFAFNDPYFRIIPLRAMAWTMNESFDPFKPLVNLHLERQGNSE